MKMPYGASWGRYLSFQASALMATFLGAQSVHMVFRPLDDLQDMIEEAKVERFGRPEESEKPEKNEKKESEQSKVTKSDVTADKVSAKVEEEKT